MKEIVLASLLVFGPGLCSTLSSTLSSSSTLWAQDAIPGGTILPVQLNSAIRSDKAKPGKVVSARVMQDVPLPAGSKIHSGAKILGHVVAVRPDNNGTGTEIALRFETLEVGGRRIAVTTSLRALASMMEVSEAQVPTTGPDRGTSEYSWTTNLIGGEVNYGGGTVAHGLSVVGRSVPQGVLVRVSSNQRGMCRGDVGADDRLQALWVFSSDACGVYGFSNLSLIHAGRTEPVGEIILRSGTGKLNIRGGSGMLLRVTALPEAK
jgi:hypothetical protein